MAVSHCVTSTDWAGTGAMLSGIGTIGGAIAVLGAAWFGATTFDRWKQQKLAERRIEQAERILTATYKVRRHLSYVRNPAMWGGELAAAEDKLKASGEWDKAGGEDERRKLTTAQAYYNRINDAKEARQNLDECLPMARALFSDGLEKAMDRLNRQFWLVQVMVDANLRDRGNLDQDFRKKIDDAIYEGTNPEGEIDVVINEQVKIIEDICVPVLRMEEPGKALQTAGKVALAAAKVAARI
ncbi:MAG TPA: hypothetical protein VF418_11320 [Sphingomonadaceae bacterium]